MAEYIALLRVLQLTLGSLIGFSCIYFGYKLFSQIPFTVTNDGSFKMPKIGEVKLKAAPGLFFAVLGAAIVYFSIDRSIQIQTAPTIVKSAQGDAKEFQFKNMPPTTNSPSEAKPGFSYSQAREFQYSCASGPCPSK